MALIFSLSLFYFFLFFMLRKSTTTFKDIIENLDSFE